MKIQKRWLSALLAAVMILSLVGNGIAMNIYAEEPDDGILFDTEPTEDVRWEAEDADMSGDSYTEESNDIILSDTEPEEADELETGRQEGEEEETKPQESGEEETEPQEGGEEETKPQEGEEEETKPQESEEEETEPQEGGEEETKPQEGGEEETKPQEGGEVETKPEIATASNAVQAASVQAGSSQTISEWSWNDEEELLDLENNILALPGASAEQPVYFDDIVKLLPSSITAEDEEIPVTWKCGTYPDSGAYEGSYVFNAVLPKGYTLAKDADPLEVTVELGGAALLAATADSIPYLDADGSMQTCDSAAVVDSGVSWGTSGEAVWYVADDDVTIESRITVSGDVRLILADGYTLTASQGIYVPSGSSLTIYGQEDGSGTLIAEGGNYQAGIGGNYGTLATTTGSITINGGTVTATGGEYGGAGIGGGWNGTGSSITINGGTVMATGGENSTGIGGGAGIGGGFRGSGSGIAINGGAVTAEGGDGAAGIGGGYYEGGSKITISGGVVTAEGGDGGAGIGGGYFGGGSGIAINGGTVTAMGGNHGAGIGGGLDTRGSSIIISGGFITAAADYGAAIGNGGMPGKSGTETEESNFTDAVVLRQSSGLGSTMTGQVYGTAVLDTDAQVPADAVLTVPESASLTLEKDMTLENSGTIYVDSELNFGGSTYGTLTGTDSVYYRLTVNGGSATAGAITYPAADGRSYAAEGASVTVAPDSKEGQTVIIIWEPSVSGVIVTDYSFTMPASPLILTVQCYHAVNADYLDYVGGGFEAKNTMAIPLTDDMTALGSAGAEIWYVVNSDVTIASRIAVSGDVRLILADGCTLTASKGIGVPMDSSLTIYGQENGTGALTAVGDGAEAGIGGNMGSSTTTDGNNGPITINGGKVTATGGGYGAGIGGGYSGSGSSITINGGTVTATGGISAAGIGGGGFEDGSQITIRGGTVTAVAGDYSAGIGGGETGKGSQITISGGFVVAVGGSGSGCDTGAAIGGGGWEGGDVNTAGTEIAESNFTNAVVLRQSGSSGSTMTGQVYGTAVLDTDAEVPTDADLTVPESASLTLQKGMTLTNSGTTYVDSELNFGGDYGTLNGTGSVYYRLTVVGGSAAAGTVTYPSENGKTYAKEKASVTVAPDSKEGKVFRSWESSAPGVTVTNHRFTMPASPLTVTAYYWTAIQADYLDYADGSFEGKNAWAIPLTSDMTVWGTAGAETWYVANSDVTIASRITVSGSVRLILADGCTLTASKGINVPSNSSLTIYGQESGTGALETGAPASYYAGIGGNDGRSSKTAGGNGPITINGGTVTAIGGSGGAGIGGGYFGSGSSITINGGTVTAAGGYSGAGIGGGYLGNGSEITISGGTVTATGNDSGAGIGGGRLRNGSKIIVSGGTVTAAGGYSGAGIGGGCSGSGSEITIISGFVTAAGGSGSGSNGAGAAIGDGGSSGTDGTKTAESNFSNAVVLRQSGSSGSAMTGKVYGNAVLDTDAAVPSDAVLTVPEDASLTLQRGMTLTNSGTIYVDSELNFGGNAYGTLTDRDGVYYWLTVVDGSATEGTVTYPATDGKTYAAEGASVTLAPDSKAGQIFRGWETSAPSVTVTNHRFTMPASILTVTALYGRPIQVDYLDYVDGSFEEKQAVAVLLTDYMTALGSAGSETWYVVNSNLTIESRITVSGDVHLILADGCTLTASQGINVPSGSSSLTVYGQESGTGALTANGGAYQAGIGGNSGAISGPITINGGTVMATGGIGGAGIGDSFYGSSGTITINGGTVTAMGGNGGTGIGGNNITINGGTVTATGGSSGVGIGVSSNKEGSNVTINGGTVTATGGNGGAGIGGNNITINGGTVTATGGIGSAGIGGSSNKWGSNVTINGGTVTATGGNFGAGIGGGSFSTRSNVTISGGFVTAIGGAGSSTYGAGAAIGNGGSSGADGTEIAESNYTNAVVLRQSGISGSAMTGTVYGSAVLDTDATVPTDAVLTVPEDTSLTLQSGMTLTNSGTIYVDAELNFGGDYGTLTGTDSVYYWLTVVDGSATAGTVTYPAADGKTYAAEGADVIVAPDDKEGETFIRWETSAPSVAVTNYIFSMPASPLTVTAKFGATVSVNITWDAMSFTYTDGAWDPGVHANGGGGWTDNGSGWFSVENNGGKPVEVACAYTTDRTDISGSFTDGTDPVPGSVTLAANNTKKLWLLLSGKPDGELDNTRLGAVTVSITEGGE